MNFVLRDWLVFMLRDWLVFLLRWSEAECVPLALVSGRSVFSGLCFRARMCFLAPVSESGCISLPGPFTQRCGYKDLRLQTIVRDDTVNYHFFYNVITLEY